MKTTYNNAIRYLVAVRLGQELGTDSELAQAIASGIDTAVRIISSLVG